MLMETHGAVIMDHRRVLRKDGDRQTETEKEGIECQLRVTESVFVDGAVAPLCGETLYCHQGSYTKHK